MSTRLTKKEIGVLIDAGGNWLIGLYDDQDQQQHLIELHEDPEWEFRDEARLLVHRGDLKELDELISSLESALNKLRVRYHR